MDEVNRFLGHSGGCVLTCRDFVKSVVVDLTRIHRIIIVNDALDLVIVIGITGWCILVSSSFVTTHSQIYQ